MSNFFDGTPPPPGEPPRRPNPDRPNPDRPDSQPMPPWASPPQQPDKSPWGQPPQQPDKSPWGQPPGQPDKSDSPWKEQPQRQSGSPWQEPPARQQPGQPSGPWSNQPPGQPSEPRHPYTPDKPTSGNSANEWAYEHPPTPSDEAIAVLSTKDWFIIYLIMCIPCVNIILGLVWAFSSTGNLNRRNFARGWLIVSLIGVGLYILGWILLFGLGFALEDFFY